MVIKQTDLQFTEGTSDKVYFVQLCQTHGVSGEPVGLGLFSLICKYGRRGSTLKEVDKGAFYNLSDAYRNYCKVIEQKKAKGYWIIGTFDHDTGSSKKPIEPKVVEISEKVEPVIESWTSTDEERSNALKRLRESCPAW
jgi:predicted DNA-binding WGR domain protein